VESADLIALIIRLGVGALATFGAILLWAQTRDSAWMLVIIGTIVHYGEIIYTTFLLFGILSSETIVFGLPIVHILLSNLPSLFYLFAFLVAMSRNRLR
jgi:hypothetical protein